MTKEKRRHRGAGTLLVKWGLEQAQKDKVPAYVEASTDGAPLYAKCGFEKVGENSWDLSKYGLPSYIPFWRMAANVK